MSKHQSKETQVGATDVAVQLLCKSPVNDVAPLTPTSAVSPQKADLQGSGASKDNLQSNVSPYASVQSEPMVFVSNETESPPLHRVTKSDDFLAPITANDWQVVTRAKGCSSRSPPTLSPRKIASTSLKNSGSPTRFDILADVREEGEIKEDDYLDLPLLEKPLKSQGKAKGVKFGKKHTVRSRDIVIAKASSTIPKKSSIRKH